MAKFAFVKGPLVGDGSPHVNAYDVLLSLDEYIKEIKNHPGFTSEERRVMSHAVDTYRENFAICLRQVR